MDELSKMYENELFSVSIWSVVRNYKAHSGSTRDKYPAPYKQHTIYDE